jgi:hypothetical protein
MAPWTVPGMAPWTPTPSRGRRRVAPAAALVVALGLGGCGPGGRGASVPPATTSPASTSPRSTPTTAAPDQAATIYAGQACVDVEQIVEASRSAKPDTSEQVAELVRAAAVLMGRAAALDARAKPAYAALATISRDILDNDLQAAAGGMEQLNHDCGGS